MGTRVVVVECVWACGARPPGWWWWSVCGHVARAPPPPRHVRGGGLGVGVGAVSSRVPSLHRGVCSASSGPAERSASQQ